MANSQQEAKQTASLIYWLLEYCDFVGKLFLNLLKMVVIPLVLTSVICGVSQVLVKETLADLDSRRCFFIRLQAYSR